MIKKLEIKSNPKVEIVFNNFPKFIRDKILSIRKLVLETAHEIDGLNMLEETLKWESQVIWLKMEVFSQTAVR